MLLLFYKADATKFPMVMLLIADMISGDAFQTKVLSTAPKNFLEALSLDRPF